VALVREILTAAERNGIALERFDGFAPEAFRPGASAAAIDRCFEGMVEHNRHSAKTQSGIWRDIAVRKRPTEVAAQLGPVIAAGTAQGVAMPIARRLVSLIGEIDAGRRPQAIENLRALAEATEPAAAQ
jgi:2-dehydropantoate 2-reductase